MAIDGRWFAIVVGRQETPLSIIEIDRLTKRYGRRTGVDSLSLEVPAGQIFGFLGPNGSGKTTTIRVLLGLLRATEGSARIFGLDCWRDSHRIKADVGYLPGDLRLYPWLTGAAGLAFLERLTNQPLKQAGADLADRFDLDMELRVEKMSRGTRQKLGLVLTFVRSPKLLVLDEPTSGLDPLMQEQLHELLRQLAAAGHTVFFSSHTLDEVERLCDRVAILDNGRMVADESMADLRAKARRVVTISWQSARAARETAPPACIEVHERGDHSWSASLDGSAVELVKWAAAQSIADLSIGQPDLTEVFRQYYRRREPGS